MIARATFHLTISTLPEEETPLIIEGRKISVMNKRRKEEKKKIRIRTQRWSRKLAAILHFSVCICPHQSHCYLIKE
jgi:hypothetical protein